MVGKAQACKLLTLLYGLMQLVFPYTLSKESVLFCLSWTSQRTKLSIKPFSLSQLLSLHAFTLVLLSIQFLHLELEDSLILLLLKLSQHRAG